MNFCRKVGSKIDFISVKIMSDEMASMEYRNFQGLLRIVKRQLKGMFLTDQGAAESILQPLMYVINGIRTGTWNGGTQFGFPRPNVQENGNNTTHASDYLMF